MWNFWLRALTRTLLTATVNLLIAWAVVHFFLDSRDRVDGGWFVFISTVLFLYLAPILFGVKRLLIDLLLGWASVGHTQKAVVAELRRARMPSDDEYPIFDLGEYCRAVLSNSNTSPKQRLAAAELSRKESTIWAHSFALGLFYRVAAERALQDLAIYATPEDSPLDPGPKPT